MKTKLEIALVIGIVSLFFGASVSLGENVTQTTKRIPLTDRSWSDNFDSYETGSALHGQGGWAGWDNNAAATGYVSDDQAKSLPNSAEISWFTTVAADMVQQYSGYTTGTWFYRAYQYVPSTMTGTQVFILMNTYTPGTTHNSPDWSLQLEFSASGGYIRDYNNQAASVTLLTNQWVEIRVEIDLDADVQNVYYNNALFITKSWKNGVAQGGAQNIACVDLYAGDTTSSSVYYDDLSLSPPAPPLICSANGPYTGFATENVQFTGTADGGTPSYTWSWDFGDGDTSTNQNPTHSYDAPGTYNVSLTVRDSVGVTASDTTTATIGEKQEPDLQVVGIKGGIGISASIKNAGNADATNVQWTISVTGLAFPKQKTGKLNTFIEGRQTTIKGIFFGFGKTTATVSLTCAEGSSAELSKDGKIFLIIVTM